MTAYEKAGLVVQAAGRAVRVGEPVPERGGYLVPDEEYLALMEAVELVNRHFADQQAAMAMQMMGGCNDGE